MNILRRYLQGHPLVPVCLAGLVLVAAGAGIVLASLQGRPVVLFPFQEAGPETLSAGTDIAGSAGFDRASYFIGEKARYYIRLLWRPDALTPDLETFKNSIGFFPLTKLEETEKRDEAADGVSSYELEYVLQAVDVEPSSVYELAPPTVFYTRPETGGELHSLRLPAPQVRLGGYYPADVSDIPLLPPRGPVHDPAGLRRGVMALFAGLLLVLGSGLLWRRGRVRPAAELVEPERLWRRFHGLDRGAMDNRDYLLHCERIYTRLLEHCTRESPLLFWSGEDPDEQAWKDANARARELLIRGYEPEQPSDAEAGEIAALIGDLLAPLVEQERLRREQQPSFAARLAKQPAVVVLGGALAVAGLLGLGLAARPGLWLSPDIAAYNAAVKLIGDRETLEEGFADLADVADGAQNNTVKAAALYNTGTLAFAPGPLSGLSTDQENALLEVMYQDQKVFLEALMHSLRIDDAFTLITLVTDSVRGLTKGEEALKAAVRLNPGAEDIRRNLELQGRRRRALADVVQQLVRGAASNSDLGINQRQAIMDLKKLMEMEFPEEMKELEEEGKDDSKYYIMEKF